VLVALFQDLPEFGTENGVNDRGGGVVNSPTLMFVAALDMVLGNMKVRFQTICEDSQRVLRYHLSIKSDSWQLP
jgi:hypothetical protein